MLWLLRNRSTTPTRLQFALLLTRLRRLSVCDFSISARELQAGTATHGASPQLLGVRRVVTGETSSYSLPKKLIPGTGAHIRRSRLLSTKVNQGFTFSVFQDESASGPLLKSNSLQPQFCPGALRRSNSKGHLLSRVVLSPHFRTSPDSNLEHSEPELRGHCRDDRAISEPLHALA